MGFLTGVSLSTSSNREKKAEDIAMKKVICLLVAVSAFGICADANAATAFSKVSSAARSAAPMSQEEIYSLYTNRTWKWGGKAGGYFASKHRKFSAATNEKGVRGFGKGMWFIPTAGKLCFRAVWQANAAPSKAVTCFEHRKSGRTIYQRKLPAGDWYVFRSARANSADEYNKVVPGDYVSNWLRTVKRSR
jgi:hypothetical protein